MANERCTNESCVDKEIQLRLARLREELLTSFNSLLIDRIRFLEQTINRLSLPSPSTMTSLSPTLRNTRFCPRTITTNRLTPPSLLRRSSSVAASFLQSPYDSSSIGTKEVLRLCSSNIDLSSNNEQPKWFLSIKKSFRPIRHWWASSTNDLPSSSVVNSCKGRLESRRFACDVDNNDVRALKAMVYMGQAQKQHLRPLTRLRQALGISSHTGTGSLITNNSKR